MIKSLVNRFANVFVSDVQAQTENPLRHVNLLASPLRIVEYDPGGFLPDVPLNRDSRPPRGPRFPLPTARGSSRTGRQSPQRARQRRPLLVPAYPPLDMARV